MKNTSRLYASGLGLLLLWISQFIGCNFPGDQNRDIPQIQLTIQNTLPIKRENVPIVLSLAELAQVASGFSFDAYLVVYGQPPVEVPSQADDTNYDGQKDELVFLVDLEPQETKSVTIRYARDNQMAVTLGFTRRTRAGIFPELGGFAALESEGVAYLLHSNGSINAYGKKTKGLFLDQFVRQIAGPSDSDEQILTPLIATEGTGGESGFGLWDTENQTLIPFENQRDYVRVLADGPVRSVVQRVIPNWSLPSTVEISLTSTFSIYAGHQWGEHQIKVQGMGAPYSIATRLPNRGIAPVKSEKEGWAWTWDAETETAPEVGFGVIHSVDRFDTFSDSVARDSTTGYTVLMKPDENGEVAYRFASAWGEGDAGIATKDAFAQYVQAMATEIRTPPVIRFIPQEPKE